MLTIVKCVVSWVMIGISASTTKIITCVTSETTKGAFFCSKNESGFSLLDCSLTSLAVSLAAFLGSLLTATGGDLMCLGAATTGGMRTGGIRPSMIGRASN